MAVKTRVAASREMREMALTEVMARREKATLPLRAKAQSASQRLRLAIKAPRREETARMASRDHEVSGSCSLFCCAMARRAMSSVTWPVLVQSRRRERRGALRQTDPDMRPPTPAGRYPRPRSPLVLPSSPYQQSDALPESKQTSANESRTSVRRALTAVGGSVRRRVTARCEIFSPLFA